MTGPEGTIGDVLPDDAPVVLFAEDNLTNQVVAVSTLELCGFGSEIAGDGRLALAATARRA